jgi:hypothetical protein
MRFAAVLCVMAAAMGVVPPGLRAQEPDPRAGLLQQAREEKAAQLEPPARPLAERLLLDLEGGRLFERVLSPPQGFYPKVGNITAGSGFSLGPAYRQPGLFGGHADVSTFASGSFRRYWMLEGRLTLPRLAGEKVSVDLVAQRYDFPKEDFFGIGPDALRENHVTYGLRASRLGAAAALHPVSWFTVGGAMDRLTPRVSAAEGPGQMRSHFGDAEAPGLEAQPAFWRYEAVADLNYRMPRGNPRRGGRYALTLQRYDDRAGGRYSFRRVEADVQQYISLLRERRVLALHGLVSLSDARDGAEIPFYLQRTLGGPDDLRGFRRFRFRDRHLLLLQAEYRWEIFTAVDGAVFYDAGKVAARLEDVNLRDLETNYGIGFRFGTTNGVFLRVEGAFGSRDGTHFILRFGHVF